jgi:hypothetical protein
MVDTDAACGGRLMDKEPEYFAERTFAGRTSNGNQLTIRLRIGKPHAAAEGDWTCPVSIEGLRNHAADIHGIDSLQSLVLALGFARSVLADFLDKGGALFWPDEESAGAMKIDEIFGRHVARGNR